MFIPLVAAAAKNVYMRGFKGVFRRGNTIFACGLRFCSQFSFRLNRARPTARPTPLSLRSNRTRLRPSIPNSGKAVCKYIQMGENIFQTKNRLF